jgi:polyphosphate kinase 2 (PPK2 family)
MKAGIAVLRKKRGTIGAFVSPVNEMGGGIAMSGRTSTGGKARLRLADIDLDFKLKDAATYERKLKALQLELLDIQQAYQRQGRRAIIALEGWDTAGKGGLIRRLSARLDPRTCQVWPIAAPTPAEQGRHYLYRFWRRLPPPGMLAVFDRSWYGRVLVERVEGLARKRDWRRAYDEINEFEGMLVDDGARLVKLFMHISPAEQLARFRERLSVPYKRWKLTEDDLRNRRHWPDYAKAIDEMFQRTSTAAAPWHGVPCEFKWYGRVECLKIICRELGRGVDMTPPAGDPKIAAAIAALVDKAGG